MPKIYRLNRFTTLPILLDLLGRRKLVFTNPENWEDKNDVEILESYKYKKRLKSLYLVCFTHESETIHHWKAFSSGMSGCCIEFNYSKLMDIVNQHRKIHYGIVNYLRLNEVDPNFMNIDEIPFLKRYPYRIENEYRFLYESKYNEDEFELDIDLNVINKITFSQNIPKMVLDSIKNLINDDSSREKIKINRSTVFQNDRWITAINQCSF